MLLLSVLRCAWRRLSWTWSERLRRSRVRTSSVRSVWMWCMRRFLRPSGALASSPAAATRTAWAASGSGAAPSSSRTRSASESRTALMLVLLSQTLWGNCDCVQVLPRVPCGVRVRHSQYVLGGRPGGEEPAHRGVQVWSQVRTKPLYIVARQPNNWQYTRGSKRNWIPAGFIFYFYKNSIFYTRLVILFLSVTNT